MALTENPDHVTDQTMLYESFTVWLMRKYKLKQFTVPHKELNKIFSEIARSPNNQRILNFKATNTKLTLWLNK